MHQPQRKINYLPVLEHLPPGMQLLSRAIGKYMHMIMRAVALCTTQGAYTGPHFFTGPSIPAPEKVAISCKIFTEASMIHIAKAAPVPSPKRIFIKSMG